MNELAMDRVDLNLFRVFDVVLGCGSLTQAAARLHLTQPAISNALKRLREHFDDPLFVRDGRRVVPTPLAKAIAPDVRAALESLHRTMQRPQPFPAATSTRRFVIGMRDVLESVLFPSLVREVLLEAPHLQLQSTGFERRRLERELSSGAFDMAIDVPISVGDDIEQMLLFEQTPCVAMRQGHPLAKGKLGLKQWLAARHIVVSSRRAGPVNEDLALQREGLKRDVAVRCQHYHAACELAASSDLLLVLPRQFGRFLATTLPLHLAALPLAVPKLQVMLYWPRTAEQDPGHAWLRDRLRRVRR